jgi:hypothetical protein
MEVTCRVVHEDESVEEWNIDSLSVRGAEREITGYLIEQGHRPVGRWHVEDTEGFEASRKFAPPEKGDKK